MKQFKATVTNAGTARTPANFTETYHAQSLSEAKDMFDEDCHRYGIADSASAVLVEVKPAHELTVGEKLVRFGQCPADQIRFHADTPIDWKANCFRYSHWRNGGFHT